MFWFAISLFGQTSLVTTRKLFITDFSADRVLEAGVGSGAAGLGLASVDQRITTLYGEAGRLRIVSSPLFGTVVSVLIPVIPPTPALI